MGTAKKQSLGGKKYEFALTSEHQLPSRLQHEAELVTHQALWVPSLFLQPIVSNAHQILAQTPELGQ